jgi:hypothetical protein
MKHRPLLAGWGALLCVGPWCSQEVDRIRGQDQQTRELTRLSTSMTTGMKVGGPPAAEPSTVLMDMPTCPPSTVPGWPHGLAAQRL